jgi:hypothetical protein
MLDVQRSPSTLRAGGTCRHVKLTFTRRLPLCTLHFGGKEKQMPTSRKGEADRRRALKLLAASPDGCTEAILLAHGFTGDMLAELARAGLTTGKAERVVAAGRTIEVIRVRITDAGRRIAGRAK